MAVVVFLISMAVALLNILIVILGFFKTPPGHVYLAVGHYFSDYFEYVQQIVQGMRGRWTVNNPFTPFEPIETFIGWGQYLIYGKIGQFFHWSPFFTYWFFVFVFSSILACLFFWLINLLLPQENFQSKFAVWLLALFAAPLIKVFFENNHLKITIDQLWYQPMSFFHRFGGVPHQILTTIIVGLMLIVISRLIENISQYHLRNLLLKTLLIAFGLVFLLTFAPFQVINLLSALCLVGWYYFNRYLIAGTKKNSQKLIFFIGLLSLIVFPASLFIQKSHHANDFFQRAIAWETGQFSYPSFGELVVTIGPIFFFIPLGIKNFFKQISALKLLFTAYLLISYFYLYTPLALYLGTHNRRFINPIIFVLLAVMAFWGIKNISGWFKDKKMAFKIIMTGLLIYCFWTTMVIYQSFGGVDRLSYLPKSLVNGIKVLDKFSDKKTVLTAPPLALGVIVPVFADRKVYLGRSIFTPNYEEKEIISDRFYRDQLAEKEAKKLLMKNNIGYVLISRQQIIEGNYNQKPDQLYPFLKKIFDNEEIKIYKAVIN